MSGSYPVYGFEVKSRDAKLMSMKYLIAFALLIFLCVDSQTTNHDVRLSVKFFKALSFDFEKKAR